MNSIEPLLYLEARMALQKFKCVLRQPARLTLWVIFLLWFGAFLFTRMQRATGGQYGLTLPDSVRYLNWFVPAVYIVILGVQIIAGSRRPPAAFAYPADARYLLGSRLSHVTVVFWLQVREAVFQGTKVFLALFFLSWNFAASAGGFVYAAVALLSAYVIAFGIRLPVFLAQRRLPRIPFAWLGGVLVSGGAIAVLYAIGLALTSNNVSLAFIATHTAAFPPGTWIVQALGGSLRAEFTLCALAAAVIAAGSVAASDAYPEIWEASSRLYARRSLVASGRGLWNRQAWRDLRDIDHHRPQPQLEDVRSAGGERAPQGALTLLWREWIALQRSSGGLHWPLLWLLGAATFGYLGGIAARGRSFFDILVPVVALVNIIVILGSQSTISLASELRRPIWWLSHSHLRDRILVWIAGTTIRIGPPLVAGVVMAGVAMHSWMIAFAAGPLIAGGLLLIQSIGVASYVALPGRHDMRGPGFMLRVLITYTSLGLPAIVWFLVQTVSGSAVAGVTAALCIAGMESWLLVLFSAARLEQNAMAYAAAEEH
jgi:Putative ABC exporter